MRETHCWISFAGDEQTSQVQIFGETKERVERGVCLVRDEVFAWLSPKQGGQLPQWIIDATTIEYLHGEECDHDGRSSNASANGGEGEFDHYGRSSNASANGGNSSQGRDSSSPARHPNDSSRRPDGGNRLTDNAYMRILLPQVDYNSLSSTYSYSFSSCFIDIDPILFPHPFVLIDFCRNCCWLWRVQPQMVVARNEVLQDRIVAGCKWSMCRCLFSLQPRCGNCL